LRISHLLEDRYYLLADKYYLFGDDLPIRR